MSAEAREGYSIVKSDCLQAWTKVCGRLRVELGEHIYVSWFGRLEIEKVSDGVACLSVPTRFLKSWIESHYADRIAGLLKAELTQVSQIRIDVRVSVRSSLQRSVTILDAVSPSLPVNPSAYASVAFPADPGNNAKLFFREPAAGMENPAALTLSSSPLDKRFTFANFLVGRSNQLAHAAALRIASSVDLQHALYNPLYFHALVGLGKTHLLQAIAHAVQNIGRRVIYLTAEKFMYSFVLALKAQTALAFKERLRAIDLLVIDDLQFLTGKSMQQEFCHTINALIDSGKQIVVAADRPPADLENLDERVSSRLAGGLCVDMGPPDEPLRHKILGSRIAAAQTLHPGFDVPPAVLAYVASVVVTNGRDLDGAVSRLLAYATLSGGRLTVEVAETAVRDLVRSREPRRVKIEDIQKLVAGHYNVSRADILSSRRTATVVRPRQIAMFLSKMLTLRSLPEIGRRFGGRDHTTVLHAVRKIEGLAANDRSISEELELLKRMLQE